MKGKTETGKESDKTGRHSINGDVFVFAFFLLLSFLFWYLNSLDKEVEAGIRYPVRYTNVPKARAVTSRDPARINLYLKGPGSSILKLKLSGKKSPVAVDLSKTTYRKVSGSKEADYYVVTSSLMKSFTVQLRSKCEITSIKPDTLFFILGKAESVQEAEVKHSLFSRGKR